MKKNAQAKPFKIFVLEDNEWYNKLIVHSLSMNPDYEVESFFNASDCLEKLNQQPDIITLDYRLPDLMGDEVLKRVKQENDDIQVIIISEQSDIPTAVDLLKSGAYDYIEKNKDLSNRLLNTVNNVRKKAGLKREISTLRKEVQKKYDFQKTIIGQSEAMKIVFSLIEKAIRTNITVTVFGETGTGKEVVAKAIHYNSARKDNPFVAVNVAALPAELIESELFGHEKGSFTGATSRRLGKFEEADGGTLFLDEIAEMDFAFQAKLLRALQEREIVRIGSNNPVKTDCRIIAATNKDLQEEVKKGQFRKDLYYRLFGLSIDLPPLRDREKDALILAKKFTEEFCVENKMENKELTADARKKLLSYNYPGNIRELKSIVELAATMSTTEEITANDILFNTNTDLAEDITENMSLREYNYRIVKKYLEKYNDDVKKVAEKLDVSLSTIYRMMKEMK